MNMRKLLYIMSAVAVIGICGDSHAMETVSYHSALQEQRKHSSAMSKCDLETLERLNAQLNANTRKILESGGIERSEIVSPLIHECKEIFFGTENDEDIRRYGEYEEEEDVYEAAKWMTEVCFGIPSVALRLQSLYEARGDYDRSLFWAIVSCELGYRSGAEAVGRLLILKGQQ